MSFWQILGRVAVSSEGETIQRVSDTTSVSSDGTTYTRMGATTVGSDGSTFTQMGNFSTDGSTRMGNSATGSVPVVRATVTASGSLSEPACRLHSTFKFVCFVSDGLRVA